jgi:pyruvate kinase
LLSRELLVRAIMVAGDRDDTASILSASRPAAPLIVVTPDLTLMRQANLLWGVIPKLIDPDELDRPKQLAARMTDEVSLQYGQPTVLVVKGLKAGPSDGEPTISVVTID